MTTARLPAADTAEMTTTPTSSPPSSSSSASSASSTSSLCLSSSSSSFPFSCSLAIPDTSGSLLLSSSGSSEGTAPNPSLSSTPLTTPSTTPSCTPPSFNHCATGSHSLSPVSVLRSAATAPAAEAMASERSSSTTPSTTSSTASPTLTRVTPRMTASSAPICSAPPCIDPARLSHLPDIIRLTIVASNDVYLGQVDSLGRPHGEGIYLWEDGSEYHGKWLHGEWHDRGTYLGPDGRRYVGGVSANNQRHGRGVYTRVDGSVYDGEFYHDLKHGYGQLTLPNQSIYQGNYRYGQKHGKGKTTWKDGSSFEGLYADGKRKRGILTDSFGNRSLEVYKNGKLVQAISLGQKDSLSPAVRTSAAKAHSRAKRK
mmetsp:Transcript_8494/g.26330  ORF Transcript_8494/g.26330 Transcript_8494/m.26330 type:complete len:370 (-) Transcript_8494:205-1314(-)